MRGREGEGEGRSPRGELREGKRDPGRAYAGKARVGICRCVYLERLKGDNYLTLPYTRG